MSDTDNDSIPWSDLPDSDKEGFADMMNRRFGANLTVDEAKKYYGNPEAVERDFTGAERRGNVALSPPECPACFSPLYKQDIPHLKQTGCCPNCGEDITS